MLKKETKKTNARTTAKRTVKTVAEPMPEMHECHCGAGCRCGCGGKIKKFIVLLIVFILGFAVAKFTCCRGGHRAPNMMKPTFENGCMVMESVKCPKMREMLSRADADMNGCITMDEYKSAKREMHHNMRKHHEHRMNDMVDED